MGQYRTIAEMLLSETLLTQLVTHSLPPGCFLVRFSVASPPPYVTLLPSLHCMRWNGMEEPSGVERNGCGAMGVGDRSVHATHHQRFKMSLGWKKRDWKQVIAFDRGRTIVGVQNMGYTPLSYTASLQKTPKWTRLGIKTRWEKSKCQVEFTWNILEYSLI